MSTPNIEDLSALINGDSPARTHEFDLTRAPSVLDLIAGIGSVEQAQPAAGASKARRVINTGLAIVEFAGVASGAVALVDGEASAATSPVSTAVHVSSPRLPSQRHDSRVIEVPVTVPKGDTIQREATIARKHGVGGSEQRVEAKIEKRNDVTDPQIQWQAGATKEVPRVVTEKSHHDDKKSVETVHPGAGEGLGQIAIKHHTTLAKEERLNPKLQRGWHQWGLIYPADKVFVPSTTHDQHDKKANYQVRWGDTSIGITDKFKENMKQFVHDNADKLKGRPGVIYAGEELIVREEVRAHPHDAHKREHKFTVSIEVKPGDTVSGILERHGIDPTEAAVKRFTHLNGIQDPNFIKPGETFDLWQTKYASHVPKQHVPKHAAAPAPSTNDHKTHHAEHHHSHHTDKNGYHAGDKELHGAPVTHHHGLTDADVHKILPGAPMVRIHRYTPLIIAALDRDNIDNPIMVANTFATIRAEDSGLKAISEYDSGAQYQGRADLGDTKPGYGEKYKGEGFVQETGFYNFENENERLHKEGFTNVNIVAHPKEVLRDDVDAQVLADFEDGRHWHIEQDVKSKDYVDARIAINGGTPDTVNGLEPYEEGMQVAEKVVPQNTNAPVAVQISESAPPTTAPSAGVNNSTQPTSTELAIAQEAQKEEQAWQSNGYHAPDGQNGTSMYQAVPGEADSFWCDEFVTDLENEAGAPVSSDPVNDERVSATWQNAQDGDQGYAASVVGAMPVVGEAVIHDYTPGDPDHTNIVEEIKGNRMELIGGDQTNPEIGHYDTAEDAAVSEYWIDIPTSAISDNGDDILGYIAPPAPAQVTPVTPPASPSSQPTSAPITTTPPVTVPTTTTPPLAEPYPSTATPASTTPTTPTSPALTPAQ
jgi:predicted chitinase